MRLRGAVPSALLWLALASCASRSADPPAAAARAEPPPVDPSAPTRLVDPRRPTTIETLDFDPLGLPELERATADDLPAAVREAARFKVNADRTVSFRGVDALDIEVGDARVLVANGSEPIGAALGAFDRGRGAVPAVWRGPAEVVGDGLRIVCFEGTFNPTSGIAEASRVYQVVAAAIVPALVYAYRSGRPELDSLRAPQRLVQPRVSSAPCVGRPGVELVGPSALWISASEPDPHDGVVVECAGGCPFSRVLTPIERGCLSVSVLVTEDTTGRVRMERAPADTNIFSFTLEIDWTTQRARPSGRVFVAVESAPSNRIRAVDPDGQYYEFD